LCGGELTARELVEFDTRDMARGHRCLQPAQGTVRGISPSGELLVALADSVARFRSGSLVLDRISMILTFDIGNTEPPPLSSMATE
jgi:hypothetical protein